VYHRTHPREPTDRTWEAIQSENKVRETIELIASENYAAPTVWRQGTQLSTKYARVTPASAITATWRRTSISPTCGSWDRVKRIFGRTTRQRAAASGARPKRGGCSSHSSRRATTSGHGWPRAATRTHGHGAHHEAARGSTSSLGLDANEANRSDRDGAPGARAQTQLSSRGFAYRGASPSSASQGGQGGGRDLHGGHAQYAGLIARPIPPRWPYADV